MTSLVSQASRTQFQKFQEDSAQLTTQQKLDPLFSFGWSSDASGRPPDSDKLSVASVQTSWQHVRTLFSVRKESSFPLQTRIGKDSLQPSRH
jgi:hypothetical protein